MNIRVKAIVPKKLLKNIDVQDAIARKQREATVPDLIKLFEGTVQGWENQPNFDYKQTVNSAQVGVYVGPKGEFGGSNKSYNIYRMVSLGTPAHPIPKRAFSRKWLRFRTGYISATHPGSLTSSSPKYTGPWWMARQVQHPGFPGRNFNKYIARQYEDTFMDDMQKAISEAVKQDWG